MLRSHCSLLALALLGLCGCASAPPPPAGFTLAIQFGSVNPVAIDTLRITITPRPDAAGDHAFMDVFPTMYEEGGVTVDVEDDGVLVLSITGDYVRSHLVNDQPLMPRFEIELWSDDDGPRREGPQVRATVVRAGEQIATGAAFLPGWPLELGASSQINVPCSPTYTTQCAGM